MRIMNPVESITTSKVFLTSLHAPSYPLPDEGVLDVPEEDESDDDSERAATPVAPHGASKETVTLDNWVLGVHSKDEDYDTDLEEDFTPGKKYMYIYNTQ